MNLAASLQGLPDIAARPGVQRAMKALPTLVSALLTLVIAWQLAELTWLLWPNSKTPAPVITLPATIPTTAPRLNVQRIADAHLFGLANAPEPLDPTNAPPTQMPLVLSGVMASADPKKGYAFIGESVQMAKFKRVGDALPGGATLDSVYDDRVMLNRGGRLESLTLPRPSGQFARPVVAAAPPPAQPTQFAQNLQRIAQTNPGAFSEIVRAQPRFVKGTMSGFAVYPGRNRMQFARLGLLPGDLVTEVNGTSLSDQATAQQIFGTIANSNQVNLTVVRNGQTQQITVNTAQIELPDVASGMPPQEKVPGETDPPVTQ